MAAALFAGRTAEHVDRPTALSAGLGPPGLQCPAEVDEVMAARGFDVTGHRSRTLTETMVRSADLVIGMGLRHVQEAVLLDPPAWRRTFRLKELVRRGEFVGPRLPGQDLSAWIRAAQGDRTRQALVHVSPEEDVADPYGGSREDYEATATELDDLVTRLSDLLWPRR